MELINKVPRTKAQGRIQPVKEVTVLVLKKMFISCLKIILLQIHILFSSDTDTNPALRHSIEFICLDLEEHAVCKYCGLRYVQDRHL